VDAHTAHDCYITNQLASFLLLLLLLLQAVYCCAVLASSQDLAFVLAIAWTCPNMFVTSFMQPLQNYSLGWGMSWMRYISPAGFAWQALLQLELSGRGFDCSKGAGLRALGLVEGACFEVWL
jgi:ABC-type multidrug transport system permease subunit